MKIRTELLAGLIALLFAGMANAMPVTWKLSGVSFDDGGTAKGSYTYDADTGIYSDIMIVTRGSLTQMYTNFIAGANFGFDANTGSTADGTGFLQIVLVSSMTNSGGTIALGTNQTLNPWETLYSGGGPSGASPPFRNIVDGQVTAVPEPGTLALLGLGLVALGFGRRKIQA